uniref:Olfactory receptor n=1 Tax=Erpetoichthys calabaricus TaxID=27687 RepID=A0A8C4RTG2_ERPCA
ILKEFILIGFSSMSAEYYTLIFAAALLAYELTVCGNLMLVANIMLDKKLHSPMYFLVCNLSLADIFFVSTTLPKLILMADLFAEEKSISFGLCVMQAFCIHFYGTASQLILIVMAYDRYIAICDPLRYSSILTGTALIKLCCFAWGGAFILVAVMLGLTARLPRCGTKILIVFCNNSSLFSLSCIDTSLNNIYALATTYFLSIFSFLTIIWTYGKILHCCLNKNDNRSKRKAIHTCTSHLTVYIFFEVIVLFSIIGQRYPSANKNVRNAIAILIMTIPPVFNPLIYGINTKEIRQKVFRIDPHSILK